MMDQPSFSLLASVADPGDYVSLVKLGVALLLLLGWAAAAQWIDRDTDVVKTQRERWNMIVLSGGLVACFWFFIPPWAGSLFAVGLLGWLVIAGGPMLGYIFHRNGRVVPAGRVLTIGHAKRLLRLEARERSGSDKGLRVRISDHKGDFVEPPSDRAEARDFDAVQEFLFELLWRRASDADMVTGKEKYRLVYKIDGVANEKEEGVSLEVGERLCRYLKKLAGLNVEEIRRPQTGRIKAALLSQDGQAGYTEVHTSGTTAGERLRLHIQSGPVLMRLPDLGFAPPRLESVKGFLEKRTGLLLLSAPPGHGLTTTQYAIIRSHDAYINNIHALERRRLIDLDNITQQLYQGDNSDVDYARMLQTVLRREPDIVMVAECEDRETARVATRAAAEDRKIYMGMTAKDAFDALARYMSWVDDGPMVAKALLGVVNQRLVRLLCTDCREAFRPDPVTLKKLNLPADKIERFYRPPSEPKTNKRGKEVVCPTCQGTGYVGRTGVFEVLVSDENVARLILEGSPIERIKAQCRKQKMYYLQEEGLLKVIEGVTSMNEILRCLRGNDA